MMFPIKQKKNQKKITPVRIKQIHKVIVMECLSCDDISTLNEGSELCYEIHEMILTIEPKIWSMNIRDGLDPKRRPIHELPLQQLMASASSHGGLLSL